MTDKARPPEIDQALGRVKSDMEEGSLRDLDLKPGPRTYDGNTGTIKGENDKLEVGIHREAEMKKYQWIIAAVLCALAAFGIVEHELVLNIIGELNQ